MAQDVAATENAANNAANAEVAALGAEIEDEAPAEAVAVFLPNLPTAEEVQRAIDDTIVTSFSRASDTLTGLKCLCYAVAALPPLPTPTHSRTVSIAEVRQRAEACGVPQGYDAFTKGLKNRDPLPNLMTKGPDGWGLTELGYRLGERVFWGSFPPSPFSLFDWASPSSPCTGEAVTVSNTC